MGCARVYARARARRVCVCVCVCVCYVCVTGNSLGLASAETLGPVLGALTGLTSLDLSSECALVWWQACSALVPTTCNAMCCCDTCTVCPLRCVFRVQTGNDLDTCAPALGPSLAKLTNLTELTMNGACARWVCLCLRVGVGVDSA